MIFSFIIIVCVLILDIFYYNAMIKYVNKYYKTSINVINKVNFGDKLKLRSNTNQLMRLLVLSLFWLTIDTSLKLLFDFRRIFYRSEFYFIFEFLQNYKYRFFILLGYFVYFFLHVFYNTNVYIRTVDIISSTIPTFFIVFMS